MQDIVAARDLVCHVHLADAPDLSPQAIRDSERLIPGTGVVNFTAFFAGLAAIKYTGFFTPELFGYHGHTPGATPLECVQHAYGVISNLVSAHLSA
jgi:sugar phosphate isomerase/epimerase